MRLCFLETKVLFILRLEAISVKVSLWRGAITVYTRGRWRLETSVSTWSLRETQIMWNNFSLTLLTVYIQKYIFEFISSFYFYLYILSLGSPPTLPVKLSCPQYLSQMKIWNRFIQILHSVLLYISPDSESRFTSSCHMNSSVGIRRVTSFHQRHSTLRWLLWLITKLVDSFSRFKNSTDASPCIEWEGKKKSAVTISPLRRGFHARTINSECPSCNYTYRWQMTVKNLI